MWSTKKPAEQVVKEKGLTQITDEAAIVKVIEGIIEANVAQVEQYRSGKEKVFGFFVGQTMKATKGQASPEVVNKLLKEMLK